jgi:hypothetical protein
MTTVEFRLENLNRPPQKNLAAAPIDACASGAAARTFIDGCDRAPSAGRQPRTPYFFFFAFLVFFLATFFLAFFLAAIGMM